MTWNTRNKFKVGEEVMYGNIRVKIIDIMTDSSYNSRYSIRSIYADDYDTSCPTITNIDESRLKKL